MKTHHVQQMSQWMHACRRAMSWNGCLRLGVCLMGVAAMVPAAAVGGQQLHGHVPAAVAALRPVDRPPAAQRLHLAISLPSRDPIGLKNLIEDLYNPASPNYQHYLTPAQFTEKFGPTEQDYQTVVDFTRANGLKVTSTHPNRLLLEVDGAIPDIETAFHVTLRNYQHPHEGRKFYAPDTEPLLDLAVPISSISGLDNYSIPHPNHKIKPLNATASVTPNAGSAPGGAYGGGDFRAAYVPGTTLTGAGQSVGLLQFDGYYASDIAAYKTQFGLPDVPLINVAVNGGFPTPSTGNGEVCLDIEMVLAMAPGVSSIYVYMAPNSTSNFLPILNRMVSDNKCKQLSCSWGGGTNNAETIFQQMATQGQSFFNATGDSDAFTGVVPFPSDSPSITEVGATTLSTTGAGGSYVSEKVWNWGLQGTNYIGSSGGISTTYSIPSWQTSTSMTTNQGSTTKRNLPDVALTGDNVYVLYNNGGSGAFGGTSCAAPLWAGFTALVNQQASANGRSAVGFLNPALYALGNGASYSSTFHDTTTGNNFWPSSPTKFSAVTGYDLCTGWGTPNGTTLINALAGPQPSTTTVTSSLGSTGAYGNVTFSATVTGPVATATGTVTFKDGLSVLGTGVLNASGVATFTTSTLAVGSHAINASFPGDVNYASSTSASYSYTVSPKPVTIISVVAANKVYDATTSAVLTGGTVSGTVNSETVTVVPGSGSFASANVGSQAITATGYSLSGASAANYVLSAQPSVANATITPRPVLLTSTRVYNGTTATGSLTATNNMDGSNLTVTGAANLVSKDVGVQALVATVPTPAVRVQSATGNTGANKATTMSVALTNTPVTGNTLVAVISTHATSTSTVTSITQTGASWSRVAQAANSSGSTTEIWYAPNIAGAAKAITISQASLRSAAVVMEYSGVLSASSLDQTANATGSNTASVTGTTATTQQANELWIGGIGYASSTPTLGTPLNGFTSVANVQTTSGTASSNAKVYALELFSNPASTASSGGTLSASVAWSGSIATFKTISASSLALGGSAAGNYTLAGSSGAVTITTKALTLTGVTANNRTYDGTTTANLTGSAALQTAEAAGAGSSSDGLPYTGDTVAVSGTAVAVFADKHAATGKPVTVTGYTLAGAQAGNYSVTQPAGLSANIAPLPITVTAVTATKTYDATTTATGLPTLNPPLASGDTTSVLTQAFQDSTSGTGNKVIIPSITINDNNNGANYAPTLVNCTTGTILPLPATVTLSGLAFTYDGSPKLVTATPTPSGLSVTVTYEGSTSAPSAVGSYAISAVINDANYTGSASGTLVIGKGNATIELAGLT
ncbi:MAG: YDG domain-containing protein, partial [Verrucomicrobiota bacterium]